MAVDINEEYTNIKNLLGQLKRAERISFPESGYPCADNGRGVYVIRDSDGKVLHVGRTPRAAHGLNQRLRDHLRGSSSFVRGHFEGDGNQLRHGCTFQFLVVNDERKRALLESLAIGTLCPQHLGLHQIVEG